MSVLHVKTSTVADTTDTNQIRPSDWNSVHSESYSLSGNTAGVSPVNGTNIIFAGGTNITLSGATAGGSGTISIIGPNTAPNREFVEVMHGERLTSIFVASASQFSNRPVFQPFWMDGTGLTPKTVEFMISGIGSSNRSFVVTFKVGLYSTVNGTQLTLLTSDSMGYSITDGSNSTIWNGVHIVQLTGMSNFTATAEGRYCMVLLMSGTAFNASNMDFNIWGGDNYPSLVNFMINNTTSATNATSNVYPFFGVYSVTTNGLPATVGTGEVQGGNSASLMDMYYMIREI